jgi:GrpB-like predicted nucleotidyltransferase (UPF0157 family)
VVEIVPYRPEWPAEFEALALRLRSVLGPEPRIEHIGSTAVPGLAAKDVLDVQIETHDEPAATAQLLSGAGFVHRGGYTDHLPPGATAEGWDKELLLGPPGERAVHVHVRRAGARNARYALLCRDYLRAHPEVAESYAELKRRLAALPIDRARYAETKDPAIDLIMAGAEVWAAATGWPH